MIVPTTFSVNCENLDDHPNSKLFTVTNNKNGFQVILASYGATVMSIKQPDRRNIVEEVTLCYPTVTELKTKPGSYFGCIAGRVANRIRNGKYSIDGQQYQAAINNGPDSLHGGIEGFDKKYWNSEISTNSNDHDSTVSVRFSYIAADGEESYPGTLEVNVTYIISSSPSSLSSSTAPGATLASNKLTILYHAVTLDKPTIVNLTNHTYFNLSGNCKRKIDTHRLRLWCRKYLPVDECQIPTGQLLDVYDTYFDFTFSAYAIVSESAREIMMSSESVSDIGSFFMSPRALGRLLFDVIGHVDGGGQPGLDHCFVVDDSSSTDMTTDTGPINMETNDDSSWQPSPPLSVKAIKMQIPTSSSVALDEAGVTTMITLKPVACLTDEVSGRRLTVHSTQPGVQVYTANWLPAQPPPPEMTSSNMNNLNGLSSSSSGTPPSRPLHLTQSQEMTVESILSPILHSITGIFSQSNRSETPPPNANKSTTTSTDLISNQTSTSPLPPPPFPFIQHNAICLETQDFPDAINQSPASFPTIILRPGDVYRHATTYTFDVI